MPVVPIPFSKGLITDVTEGDWLDSLPVNMLAVPKQVLDAQGYMRSWPGFDRTIDVPGIARGAVLNDVENIVYRVNGTRLINGTTGEVLADVGGTGHASMPFSRNSQTIVSDGRLYYWRDNELTQLQNWEEGEREPDTDPDFINYSINYNGASTRVDVFPWITEGRYQIQADVFIRDNQAKQWLFATSADDDTEGGIFIENGMFFIQADKDTDAVSIQEAEEGLNSFDYAGSVIIDGGIGVFGAIRRQEDDVEEAAYSGFFDGQIYNIRFTDFDPPVDEDDDTVTIPNDRTYPATLFDDEVPEETILIDERFSGEELARELLVEITGGTPATPAESDPIVEEDVLVVGRYYAVSCEVITSGFNQSGFSDRNGIGTSARVSGSGEIEHVFIATANDAEITLFTANSQATFRNVVVQDVTHGIITAGIWQAREEDPVDSVLPGTDFDLSNIIDATRNRSRYAWIQAGSNTFGVTDLQNEQRPDYIAPFYSAEAEPGINIAIDSWRDYVVVFSRDTIEYFGLTGQAENIYQPVQSLNVRAGILGITCKTHYLDHFAILGGPRPEPPSFFIVSQGQYQEIATRTVQKILREYSEQDLQTVYLETVKFDAHDILIAHLPRHTLVYDHNASGQGELRWSILKTDIQGDATYRGIYHLYDGQHWTLGDKRDNFLSRFNFGSGAHAGDRVEYMLDSMMLQSRNVWLFDLDVDNVPGRSNKAYRIAVSATYDGITWGEERWSEFDTPAEYTRRVLIRVLGYTRYNVGFRLRWITDTPTAISNLRVRFE